jgi:predicted Zn-dependent protease
MSKLKRSGSCKLTVEEVVKEKAFNREVYYGDKALRYAPSEQNLTKSIMNWNKLKKKTTFLDQVMTDSRKTIGPNQYTASVHIDWPTSTADPVTNGHCYKGAFKKAKRITTATE